MFRNYVDPVWKVSYFDLFYYAAADGCSAERSGLWTKELPTYSHTQPQTHACCML